MAARKRSPQTVVLDPSHAEPEATDTLDQIGDTAEYGISEVDASLCLCCGEPLAWHETICTAPLATSQQSFDSETTSGEALNLALSAFAYSLGQAVQPDPDAPARPVIWRGQLKARHPRTGLIHRINVYRLDNGYWDFYYEADLQTA